MNRFIGIFIALERLILLWDPVAEFMNRLHQSFPLEGKKDLIVQLCSIAAPIAKISLEAQNGNKPISYFSVLRLHALKSTLMDLESPLRHFEYCRENRLTIPHSNMHSLAIQTRKMVAEGLNSRFFCRYNEKSKNSLIMETQMFLHPNFKNLNSFMKMFEVQLPQNVAKQQVQKIQKRIEKTIYDVGHKISNLRSSNIPTSQPEITWSQSSFQDLLSDVEVQLSSSLNISDLHSEIDTYIQGHWHLTMEDCPLTWWKNKKDEFPTLSLVARSFFGLPNSSGSIELDFGVAGKMVTRFRHSLSGKTVEMCQVISRNRQLVDLKTVPVLSAEEGVTCLPESPEASEGRHPILSTTFSGEPEFEDEFYQHLDSLYWSMLQNDRFLLQNESFRV